MLATELKTCVWSGTANLPLSLTFCIWAYHSSQVAGGVAVSTPAASSTVRLRYMISPKPVYGMQYIVSAAGEQLLIASASNWSRNSCGIAIHSG
jgi:hypothetical protein